MGLAPEIFWIKAKQCTLPQKEVKIIPPFTHYDSLLTRLMVHGLNFLEKHKKEKRKRIYPKLGSLFVSVKGDQQPVESRMVFLVYRDRKWS